MAGVFEDGSDLISETTPTGSKGSVVLKSAPKGEPIWDFELVLSPGLVPVQSSDSQGGVRIIDPTNAGIGFLPAGVAIDAAGQTSPLEMALNSSPPAQI